MMQTSKISKILKFVVMKKAEQLPEMSYVNHLKLEPIPLKRIYK